MDVDDQALVGYLVIVAYKIDIHGAMFWPAHFVNHYINKYEMQSANLNMQSIIVVLIADEPVRRICKYLSKNSFQP